MRLRFLRIFSVGVGNLSEMKKGFLLLLLSSFAMASDGWNGTESRGGFSFATLPGIGFFEGQTGLLFAASLGARISDEGLIPEVNDEVFVEATLGPAVLSLGKVLLMSVHARWNFHHQSQWGLYGLGGIGAVAGGPRLGNFFRVYPRFGVGGEVAVTEGLYLRTELSHELLVTGFSYHF